MGSKSAYPAASNGSGKQTRLGVYKTVDSPINMGWTRVITDPRLSLLHR